MNSISPAPDFSLPFLGANEIRRAMDCAPTPMAIIEQAQVLIYANEALEFIVGKAASKQLRRLSDYVDSCEELDRFLSTPSSLEKKYIRNVTLKRINGEFSTFDISVAVLKNNEYKQFVVTFIDATEKIDLACQLENVTDKLAKVNSLMERFLYSSSHDLRSPLTSILGLVNLMRIEGTDQTILQYATRIESCAQRLDKILKDIIDFSKTTYQRVRSKRIDFSELIWKVIANRHKGPDVKNMKFDVVVNDSSPFYSDPERMQIIFDNIIGNSINFADKAKTFSFLRVRVDVNENNAAIHFSDNGIGIGKMHLDNVFNIFYKASDVSNGAGLGLYIVKEGVKQLNGSISLESEIGFGTAIAINIPNNPKGRLISRKLLLVNR